MSTKTILNILTLAIIMIAGFFKINHWEGAKVLMLTGSFFLTTTLIFTVKELRQDGFPAPLTYLIATTLLLHVTGAIFKSMHWQGAGMLVLMVYAFTVVTAIFLILNKSEIKLSRQLVVTLFLYLVLILNLLMQTHRFDPL